MGSGYEISVKDVGQILRSLDGQHAEFLGALADLGRLAVPAAGYGQVGGTAAHGSTTSQQQLAATLQALGAVLRKLNERIRTSARDYDDTDRRFASDLDRMTALRDGEAGRVRRS